MSTSLIQSQDFQSVLAQIQQTRTRIFSQANTSLIDLYCQIGQTISQRVQSAGWGEGVVAELAGFIAQNDPRIKGFSDKNLWRMKQFYETYQRDEKLSPLVRELPWTHNTIIFSRCKSADEPEYYLRLCQTEQFTKRDLECQIDAASFEGVSLGGAKLSPAVRELYPDIAQAFKDSYILEFFGLPDELSERDLQSAFVRQMRQCVLELVKDFIFVDENYRLQVGNQDFFVELLFLSRGLSALMAFEVKIGAFKPEHLGQLSFYLEALDRDAKKQQENPSMGVLLSRDKDDEVVEYALSRNLSPALIAEYHLQLPEKKLLQARLHTLSVNAGAYDEQ